MPTPHELEDKLWEALKSDRTVMLGLDGAEGGHARPMTAQFEERRGPIWFFSARDHALVRDLDRGGAAHVSFVAKDHGLFASLGGELRLDTDRAVLDRLWNPFVAAWYEGGKDDPNLALLRFDADHAEIWENASSLLAGLKLLFGADPKRDYAGKVARVDLH
ncbi:MAG TPA: pyridoxamine 5'-phosphate oxidase family protein [Xanthomonadaceae bacterium]|nr:pyridoxamine 5'-phosphate oxidase family protein [Xanthomonadaceae bacterium]